MKVLSRCRHGNPACKVTSHQEECGTDTTEITLAIAPGVQVVSIITTNSVERLDP